MSAPVKFYGPGILTLPVGFISAKSREAQIDILYDAADDPRTNRRTSEKYLRMIKKIEKTPQSNPGKQGWISCKAVKLVKGKLLIKK